MFTALVHTKKKKKNPSDMSSSRPRDCTYRGGQWICTLANGRKLEVSGQSLIKALRTAAGGVRSIRTAKLRYPTSGRGQCVLHVSYQNGRTEIVRGRCVGLKAKNPPASVQLPQRRGTAGWSPTDRPSSSAPGSGCCFDAELMILVCQDPNNPYNGRGVVEIVTLDEQNAMAVVRLVEGETVTVPLCPDDDTKEPPGEADCCYDPQTNKLLCKDTTSPLNGADVTLERITEGAGPGGTALATVYVGGDPSAGMRVPVCETPECCLDLATSKLICPNTNSPFHGLTVSVEQVSETLARISHSSLRPHGFAYVPLCKTPPEETDLCCFNQDTMTIVCQDPNNPLHGKTAGIVTEFAWPQTGQPAVSVAWEGGGARMLLCGRTPPDRCPPSYCCVNIDTMTFVCPGSNELNGQRADIVDIIEHDGYSYGVLSDSALVPICGKDCPPPELCPDGLWRTPTGECRVPTCPECPDAPDCPPPTTCPECPPNGGCPTCPPGFLLDTQTGQCVQCPPQRDCPPQQPCFPPGGGGWPPIERCCPEDEPWWKQEGHCCENCALGKQCGGDCGCGGDDHKHANPPAPPKGCEDQCFGLSGKEWLECMGKCGEKKVATKGGKGRRSPRPSWMKPASWLLAFS